MRKMKTGSAIFTPRAKEKEAEKEEKKRKKRESMELKKGIFYNHFGQLNGT